MRANQQILFVEIGRKLPKFARNNLQYLRKHFPELHIVLLTDYEYKQSGIEVINTESLEEVSLINEFKNLQKDWGSRLQTRYWNLTTERFFWIYHYMTQMRIQSLIHIESDVVILDPFALDDLIENSSGLAYSLQNSKMGCAGVFAVNDSFQLKEFLDFVIQNWSIEHQTDQTLLAKWAILNPNKVQIFNPIPSLPISNSHAQGKIGNYLVDPGDFGIYLFGNDARNNHLPISKLGVDINAQEFQEIKRVLVDFRLEKKDGVFSLSLERDFIKLRLITLHFHSKRVPKTISHLRFHLTFRKIAFHIKLKNNSMDSFYFYFSTDFRVLIERLLSKIGRRFNSTNRFKDFRLR